MKPLAQRLLSCMARGELTIIPQFEEKTLRNFLENIEPWCISRQIRWGHPLPIWKLEDRIEIAEYSPGAGFIREEGVLDTWFSSALWPFAALGWPNETADLQKYYPADIIETGADILFFWCARMLMMGLLLTDQLPFRTIYLHGLIRDEEGEKMSKSLGNGIDPLSVTEKYGTDALRIALLEGTTPAQDMEFRDENIKSARALATKLWNASKFSLSHYQRLSSPALGVPNGAHDQERAILEELQQTIEQATFALEQLDFRAYSQCVRKFLWDRFCSQYLEGAKERLYAGDLEALMTLMYTLRSILILIHPMAPFISEKIWGCFNEGSLIEERWPSKE